MSDSATFKTNNIAPFADYDQDWAGFIWFEQFLLESNPTAYQQLVSGQISYTSAPVVAAMNAWKTVADDGYFATPEDIDTDLATPTAFVNGFDAMLLIGSWEESNLIAAGMKPGKDFGAFVMPPLNPKVGWQAIFETGPGGVGAQRRRTRGAQVGEHVYAALGPGGLGQAGVVRERGVVGQDRRSHRPSVASEIKTESVHLVNRYWEVTPPQIAVPAGFGPFPLHLGSQPAPDAVPEDAAVVGHLLLVDGEEVKRLAGKEAGQLRSSL